MDFYSCNAHVFDSQISAKFHFFVSIFLRYQGVGSLGEPIFGKNISHRPWANFRPCALINSGFFFFHNIF